MIEKWSAALLLAFGAVTCFVSLILPPQGEIDGSVLMLFGQIIVYAGSIFGVKIYINDLIKRVQNGAGSNSAEREKGRAKPNDLFKRKTSPPK